MESDFQHSGFSNTGTKIYAVQQIDQDGDVLSEIDVEATNSEAAAKHLKDVQQKTTRIAVCLDGEPMNEMDVEHWRKRIRRR